LLKLKSTRKSSKFFRGKIPYSMRPNFFKIIKKIIIIKEEEAKHRQCILEMI